MLRAPRARAGSLPSPAHRWRAARTTLSRSRDVAIGARHDEPALAERAAPVTDGWAVVGDRRIPGVLGIDVRRRGILPIRGDDRPRDESSARAVQGGVVLSVDQPGHVDVTADIEAPGHDQPPVP